jgi:ribosomal protein S18 acetylase RimI-like enzyme
MDPKIIEYHEEHREQVIKLFEDFQDYLISIDPIKRLCRMPGFGENKLKQTLDEVKEYNGKFYLAMTDSVVIGLIAGLIKDQSPEDLLSATQARRGRVTELFIDEKYRGQGLGKKLMSTMEEYFRDQGCKFAWVEVFVPNIRAHGLYNKLGFNDRDIDMIKEL